MRRARVVIEGRVQGVAFRESTRSRARALGVRGFVRNLSDGRVEAIFEGEPEAVAALVEFAQRGPPAARVTCVEVHDEPATREFSDFCVRY
jgi:acylphosphatase